METLMHAFDKISARHFEVSYRDPQNLVAWLVAVKEFLEDCSDTSGLSFRKAVHLRNLALAEMKEAAKKGVRLPAEIGLTIYPFPGKFAFLQGEFHYDVFSENLKNWEEDLAHLITREDNRVLEIGSYEGLSSSWIVANLLKGKKAHLTCVDVFPDEAFDCFKQNVRAATKSGIISVKRGRSQKLLPTLPTDHFDFIYIDGSHKFEDVKTDLENSWPMLKNGGILTVDDYLLADPQSKKREVKLAVDQFLDCFQTLPPGGPQVLRRERQVTLRKGGSSP